MFLVVVIHVYAFFFIVRAGVTKRKQDTGFEYKRTIWAPTLGDIPSYSIEVSTEGEWNTMEKLCE